MVKSFLTEQGVEEVEDEVLTYLEAMADDLVQQLEHASADGAGGPEDEAESAAQLLEMVVGFFEQVRCLSSQPPTGETTRHAPLPSLLPPPQNTTTHRTPTVRHAAGDTKAPSEAGRGAEELDRVCPTHPSTTEPRDHEINEPPNHRTTEPRPRFSENASHRAALAFYSTKNNYDFEQSVEAATTWLFGHIEDEVRSCWAAGVLGVRLVRRGGVLE